MQALKEYVRGSDKVSDLTVTAADLSAPKRVGRSQERYAYAHRQRTYIATLVEKTHMYVIRDCIAIIAANCTDTRTSIRLNLSYLSLIRLNNSWTGDLLRGTKDERKLSMVRAMKGHLQIVLNIYQT